MRSGIFTRFDRVMAKRILSRRWATLFVLGSWAVAFCSGSSPADEPFRALFDGQTLTGWQGDPQLWRVDDGQIVGSTEPKKITKNTFLATDKAYRNFVLRLKFKLRNGNSGVQIRSKTFPEFVVRGYQADIAEERYMGILYEEGGRGILADVADPQQVTQQVKADDWNTYEITANGPHIRQVLNGFATVDYNEQDAVGAKEGIIALQLHVGPAMEVRFKDIELRELP